MENVPFQCVQLWLSYDALNPRQLLPALLKYNPIKLPHSINENQAIRYLEYCIFDQGNIDSAIHNYVIKLYATEQEEKYGGKLISFVKGEVRSV